MQFDNLRVRQIFCDFLAHLHEKHRAQRKIRRDEDIRSRCFGNPRKFVTLSRREPRRPNHHVDTGGEHRLGVFKNDRRIRKIDDDIRFPFRKRFGKRRRHRDSLRSNPGRFADILARAHRIDAAEKRKRLIGLHRPDDFAPHPPAGAIHQHRNHIATSFCNRVYLFLLNYNKKSSSSMTNSSFSLSSFPYIISI